ncbi:uncharacterized protein LOC123870456 [Maniola jurtina]|uniref:uncharacterized protein LOC123870456 n=1 Tax=Maniola jurtina TaxID=191418 RepID=UPI001E689999|nr:uncharacterized protein LOC123870456 [Maniola jurtina]
MSAEYILTTARVPTRCLIPQCDVDNPEYAPEWLLNAIPGTSMSSFDNCARYRNSSAASGGAGQCAEEWFDFTQTEPCDEYVYQNTLSIVYGVQVEGSCHSPYTPLLCYKRPISFTRVSPQYQSVSEH